MAGLKTKPSRRSVREFLQTVGDMQRRQDCAVVATLMRRATGQRAMLWNDDIVGYGHFEYTDTDGQPVSTFVVGFSPGKQDLTIYIMPGLAPYDALIKRLGKYRPGESCLHVKLLSDINIDVLAELIERSVRDAVNNGG